MHGWTAYNVLCKMLFAVAQITNICEHIIYAGIPLKTFKNYSQLLTRKIDKNIGDVLPDKNFLFLNFETTPDARYIALFGTFAVLHLSGFWSVSLDLSPLKYRTTQNSNEYIQLCHLYSHTLRNILRMLWLWLVTTIVSTSAS